MKAENKLLRSHLLLVKQSKTEIRLTSKGKAKLLYHFSSMSYDFSHIFFLPNIISLLYLWLILYCDYVGLYYAN